MAAIRSEVSPASLADRAYQVLEDKLIRLELEPGAVVSEGELIRLTGLGRTPVREAMQRLAQQELFHVLPRKGLLVTPVSLPDILHVLETRKPLERVIVYRAALNARDEQRGGLAAVARDLAIAHDDIETFIRLDKALADMLDVCSGNAYASAAAAPLRTHCRRFWYCHRQRMQLSDAISAESKMARLVARRDTLGAQKAVDGMIAGIERLAASIDRFG